ncbi:MarR family transcriptional regulator [Williamsia sterculiae]|uniref:Transcriptional regulator n=1 Tax=Williamsia sterculiae TaxID=1344003 RepID=A0A1N7GYX9_9NOCA|nr:MarR family transcriptional regulator [Williamsia sterculiae]SIS17795.1 transcriptional regulator [Williamsia sterculiae]
MRAAELHRLARLLRQIALEATGNTGSDRVNAGELAVLEDVARHPGSTVADIVSRTGLAQSLVSRIVHAAADAGALTVVRQADRRKLRIELAPATRRSILQRADNDVGDAIATHTPMLSHKDRVALIRHLRAASMLLRQGTGDATPVSGVPADGRP